MRISSGGDSFAIKVTHWITFNTVDMIDLLKCHMSPEEPQGGLATASRSQGKSLQVDPVGAVQSRRLVEDVRDDF